MATRPVWRMDGVINALAARVRMLEKEVRKLHAEAKGNHGKGDEGHEEDHGEEQGDEEDHEEDRGEGDGEDHSEGGGGHEEGDEGHVADEGDEEGHEDEGEGGHEEGDEGHVADKGDEEGHGSDAHEGGAHEDGRLRVGDFLDVCCIGLREALVENREITMGTRCEFLGFDADGDVLLKIGSTCTVIFSEDLVYLSDSLGLIPSSWAMAQCACSTSDCE